MDMSLWKLRELMMDRKAYRKELDITEQLNWTELNKLELCYKLYLLFTAVFQNIFKIKISFSCWYNYFKNNKSIFCDLGEEI